MRFKKLSRSTTVCVVTGLIISFLTFGCSTGGTQKLVPVKTKILNVGITANYPPLAFKEDKALKGIEVELARALGDDLKRRIVFKEMAFGELIPALQSKEIDIIMSGMSVTADRKEAVFFTQPYLYVGQMAIIRKSDMANYTNPASIYQGKMRVGYEEGATGEVFVKANMMQAEKIPVVGAEMGLDALRKNGIDIFIHDAPTAWRIAENVEENTLIPLYWPLTEELLAWAVNRKDIDLLEEINAVLSEWKQDGRLQAILNKWIRVKITVN